MAVEINEVNLLRSRESPEDRRQLLAELFLKHRDKLRLMVKLRLHPRLKARIDPSDVIQEAYLEAAERMEEYLRKPPMSLFLRKRYFRAVKRLKDLFADRAGSGGDEP